MGIDKCDIASIWRYVIVSLTQRRRVHKALIVAATLRKSTLVAAPRRRRRHRCRSVPRLSALPAVDGSGTGAYRRMGRPAAVLCLINGNVRHVRKNYNLFLVFFQIQLFYSVKMNTYSSAN